MTKNSDTYKRFDLEPENRFCQYCKDLWPSQSCTSHHLKAYGKTIYLCPICEADDSKKTASLSRPNAKIKPEGETLLSILVEGFVGHLAGLIMSLICLAIIFGLVQSCVAGIAGGY